MKRRVNRFMSLALAFAMTFSTVMASDISMVSAFAAEEVANEATEEDVAIGNEIVNGKEYGIFVDKESIVVSVNESSQNEELSFSYSIKGEVSGNYITDITMLDYYSKPDPNYIKGIDYTIEETGNVYTVRYTREGIDKCKDVYGTATAIRISAVSAVDPSYEYYEYVTLILNSYKLIGNYFGANHTEGSDHGLLVTIPGAQPYSSSQAEFYYTGQAITPRVEVFDGYEKLTTNDFSVKYKNNKNPYVGNYKKGNLETVDSVQADKAPQIIITFKGAYKGTKPITKYFDIVPASWNARKDVCASSYVKKNIYKQSAKSLTPTVAVEIKKYEYDKGNNRIVDKKGNYKYKKKALKLGKDYTVKYISEKEFNENKKDLTVAWAKADTEIPANSTGRFYALISGNALKTVGNKVEGGTIEQSIDVTSPITIIGKKDISKAKASLSINSFSFNLLDETDFDVLPYLADDSIKIGGESVSKNSIESAVIYKEDQGAGNNRRIMITTKPDSEFFGQSAIIKSNIVITGDDINDCVISVNGIKAENNKVSAAYNSTSATVSGDRIVALRASDEDASTIHSLVDYITVFDKDGNDVTDKYVTQDIKIKKGTILGKGQVILVGKGLYAGTKRTLTLELTLEDSDLTGAISVNVARYVYNEDGILIEETTDYVSDKRSVSVGNIYYAKKIGYKLSDVCVLNGIHLGEEKGNKYYKVKYAKPKLGVNEATITFNGEYKKIGMITLKYNVIPEDGFNISVEAPTVKSTKPLTSDQLLKKVKIKVNDASGKNLKVNKDYTVSNILYSDQELTQIVSANETISANKVYYTAIKSATSEYAFDMPVSVRYGVAYTSKDLQKLISGDFIIYQKGDVEYFWSMLPTITINIDGKDVTLERGKDYYIDLANDKVNIGTPGKKQFVLKAMNGSNGSKLFTDSVKFTVNVKMRENAKPTVYKYVLSK